MTQIKPVLRCPGVDKKIFKNSRCLLTISVGQEVHEGEKFAATVDLINESFGSCILLIDDSLQRYSMALNSRENSETFYPLAIQEGDEWLQRNKKYYERLTNLKQIIRWDFWLHHPVYIEQELKIKTLFSSESSYASSFQKTNNNFLTRYIQRLSDKSNFDMVRAQALCFNYLLEECTALCLWTELECHFEVYPSRRNPAMHETHKYFVLPKNPDLLHAVSIKFKNRKQFQPQYFSTLVME